MSQEGNRLTRGQIQTQASPNPTFNVVYLLATLPPLFWAGNFLIARAMRDFIPPFQMSFWRWVIAFVLLLPFVWRSTLERRADIKNEFHWLLMLGAIGVTAFNCLIYEALHHTTVINAALINSLMPAVTILLALIILRERAELRKVLGLALSSIGAALIISRGDLLQIAATSANRGDLLVLFGLTFWALYTVLIRWRPSRLPPLVFLTTTIGIGTLLHLPLVTWEYMNHGGFILNAHTVGAILYLAIFPSILAYILWNRAVRAIGPGRTGIFMHSMPMFSAVLAAAILDETFAVYHAYGFVLIVCGIVLASWVVRRKPETTR